MSYQIPLGYVLILLSEVEQQQRPSGNEDREAIVVGAGLCDTEGERAYTANAQHYDISWSWHSFLELEWSWLNFVVTWLKYLRPNDSTKKLSQMVLSQVTGNHLINTIGWPPMAKHFVFFFRLAIILIAIFHIQSLDKLFWKFSEMKVL